MTPTQTQSSVFKRFLRSISDRGVGSFVLNEPQSNHVHMPPSATHLAHAESHVHAATVVHPAPTIHPTQAYAPPFMPQPMLHTETQEEYPRLARREIEEYRRCQEQGLL